MQSFYIILLGPSSSTFPWFAVVVELIVLDLELQKQARELEFLNLDSRFVYLSLCMYETVLQGIKVGFCK